MAWQRGSSVRQKIEFLLNSITNVKTGRHAIRKMSRLLKENGEFVAPIGLGNIKTGLPGFYRKVGDNCPTCKFKNDGCYAQLGYVGIVEKRSPTSSEAALNGFLISTIVSQKYYNKPSRLFVSGDIFINGEYDKELHNSLIEAGQILQTIFGTETLAYGYTHGKNLLKEIKELKSAGIVLLQSEFHGVGGSVVHHFNKFDELKSNEFRYIKCPAQLRKDFQCSDCKLCIKSYEKKLCIVFNPHGALKGKFK